MIKSIFWYVNFVITLIFKTPYMYKAKKILKNGSRKEFDEYVSSIVSKWAYSRVKASGAKITVHGENLIPSDRNVLFVSNHQSDFDIGIFLGFIDKPKGFVAKVEMEKLPLISTWMKFINCVFMDRNDLKQSLQTIIEGIKILKEGYSLVVFPEGTRSKSNKIGEFKPGSFKLATKSKVPIVPVTINGSYKIMEGNNYKICPEKVDVYIHQPIYLDSLTKDEINNLPIKVKSIIQEKLDS